MWFFSIPGSIFGGFLGVVYFVSATAMISFELTSNSIMIQGLTSVLMTFPYWLVTAPFRRRTIKYNGKAYKRYFDPWVDGSRLEWILAVIFCCGLMYLIGVGLVRMIFFIEDNA